MINNNWTTGDVSGSKTLTDNDHLYPAHFNEIRDAMDHSVYVDNYSGDDLGEKINNARADNGDTWDNTTIILPSGAQTITTSANFTCSSGFTVLGQGTQITVQGSGLVGLDFTGARLCTVHLNRLIGVESALAPAVGILQTASPSYNGDQFRLQMNTCYGRYTVAPLYKTGGEDFTLFNTSIENYYAGGHAIVLSRDNEDSITSLYATITNRSLKSFYVMNGHLGSMTGKGDSIVRMQGDEMHSGGFYNVDYRSTGEPIIEVDLTGNKTWSGYVFKGARIRNRSAADSSVDFIKVVSTSGGGMINGISIMDVRGTLNKGTPGTNGLLLNANASDGDIELRKAYFGGSFELDKSDGLYVDGDVSGLVACVSGEGISKFDIDGTLLYAMIIAKSVNMVNGQKANIIDSGIGRRSMETQKLIIDEVSSDPNDPAEGQSVVWQSDGTETGADGDILMKVTAAGATKTYYLAKKTQPDYTTTNVTTDRAFNADTVVVAELADVVGTLIADLTANGILQ